MVFSKFAGVAVAAAVVVAGSVVVAPGADARTRCNPRLDTTISKSGLDVDGPKRVPAGALRLRLRAVGDEREVSIVRFKGDYGPADLRHDVAAAFPSAPDAPFGKAALRRALKHTTFLGGLDVEAGKSAKMSVALSPGKYYVYDNSGDLPTSFHRLRVVPSRCGADLPDTTATVTMKQNHRFGGDKVLPHKGSIDVRNVSKDFDESHFLFLQHVKDGTTLAQVRQAFDSPTDRQPAFVLPGQVGTDTLSPGKHQVLTYSLPRGTYLLACYYPDLDEDGTPHAFMGMIRIVRLK